MYSGLIYGGCDNPPSLKKIYKNKLFGLNINYRGVT
jgi:hypothetical protein